MGAESVVLVFLAFAGIVVVIRLVAGSMDGGRIDAYIRRRGGCLISKEWNPFGKGWFGDDKSRIYRIRYTDADGYEHEATCKTSLLGGVYMTQDDIVEYSTEKPLHKERLYEEPAPPEPLFDNEEDGQKVDIDAVLEENRRLREEIRRLKGE